MSKLLLTTCAAALIAAAKIFKDAADSADAAPTDANKPKPGRPPKTKETPPANDDLGDDLGGGDGLDDLGDGLDDGLGEAEPAQPKAPTQEAVRAKLLELQKKDGNNTRVHKLMKAAIGDDSKQPTVPNIPAAKYKAVLDAVTKYLAAK